jgi:hypothetical protein
VWPDDLVKGWLVGPARPAKEENTMSDTDSKGRGRPTIYSDELAATICQRMAEGESLRRICGDDDMPDKSTVLRWLGDDSHPGFREQYAHATEMRADFWADEIVEVAYDGTGDTTEDDSGRKSVNQEVVARSRLKVDTLKWLMERLVPKKYGNKLQHTGDLTVRYEDALKELE